jgi:hypothetical protein
LEVKRTAGPELFVSYDCEGKAKKGIVGLGCKVSFFMELFNGIMEISIGMVRLIPTVEAKPPRKRLEVSDVGMFNTEA